MRRRAGLKAGEQRAEAPDAAEVVRLQRRHRVAVEEGRARRDAGVVDEDRERRMPVEYPLRRRVDCRAIGDVADLVFAVELLRERAQTVLATREQDAAVA